MGSLIAIGFTGGVSMSWLQKILAPERHAKTMAVLFALVATLGAGAVFLHKDTEMTAFEPIGGHAPAAYDAARAQFGLEDPIVIALVGELPMQALSPAALASYVQFEQKLAEVPGVDPEGIFSLVSQPVVSRFGEEVQVSPLLSADADFQAAGQSLRAQLHQQSWISGLLISADGRGLLMAADVRGNAHGGQVYKAVKQMADDFSVPSGLTLHVAGRAAVDGYYAEHVDRDATMLTGVGVVLILILLALYFQRFSAVVIGGMVMLGSIGVAMGVMGWTDGTVYIITSSLPAVLLCIAVADTIHFVGRADRYRQRLPSAAAAGLALKNLLRPMSLTTLTTAAGFFGLAVGHDLLPMREYGIYAAVGSMAALIITLIGVPVLYVRLAPEGKPRTEQRSSVARHAVVTAFLVSKLAPNLGRITFMWLLLLAVALFGLTRLQANEELVTAFAAESDMVVSNQAINKAFAGTHDLDLVIRVPQGRSLSHPDSLAALSDMQRWMQAQGGFSKTASYVDIAEMMADSLDSDAPLKTADGIEQLLFLYEASGRPGLLDEWISTDRRAAYVRGYLKTDNYQQSLPLIAALRERSEQLADTLKADVEMTGPVYLTNQRFHEVPKNTLIGTLIAVFLVGLIASIALRSIRSGLMCLLPVCVSVAAVLGLMGWLGIWLNIATAMFCAIAIGLGVDFSIHTQHAVEAARERGLSGRKLVEFAYGDVGSPLTASAVLLTLGFSVTMLSAIPPVRDFGLVTATAIVAAYLSALILIPAIASSSREKTIVSKSAHSLGEVAKP